MPAYDRDIDYSYPPLNTWRKEGAKYVHNTSGESKRRKGKHDIVYTGEVAHSIQASQEQHDQDKDYEHTLDDPAYFSSVEEEGFDGSSNPAGPSRSNEDNEDEDQGDDGDGGNEDDDDDGTVVSRKKKPLSVKVRKR